MTGLEAEALEITKEEEDEAIILSHHVMGNGHNEEIRDIIYIDPESFDPAKTHDMAREIDTINTSFMKDEKEYILIVAGRLGSSDPWLGIPVVWSQISAAGVIVETSLPGFFVEPSQGTHFFQNITSLGTIYFSVSPSYRDGVLNFEKLQEFETVNRKDHFIHIRSEQPFVVKADGRNRLGVICPGS